MPNLELAASLLLLIIMIALIVAMPSAEHLCYCRKKISRRETLCRDCWAKLRRAGR